MSKQGKINISNAQKGREHQSQEGFQEGHKINVGIKRSKETRRKMALGKIGDKNPAKRLDVRQKISRTKMGVPSLRKGKPNFKIRGENHWNWKGGITPKIIKRCNSVWWKELRKLIYQRDNWTCQMCGKKCHKDIQCHHIIPERSGGNHTPENLITLCRSCHIKVDKLLREDK